MSNSSSSTQDNFPIVVIGASAGGFEAIKRICSGLPADLGAAVFIVWHLSPDVTGILPLVINKNSKMFAKHPEDHEILQKNQIYVAPPDHHMTIYNSEIRITKGPKENRFRPAIDTLFRSAAYFKGPLVKGVVLSGFLDDGASGLWTIKDYGGTVIIQDPADAEVPAMPLNAMKAVEPDHVVVVDKIAQLLIDICRQEPKPAPARPSDQDRVRMEIDIVSQELKPKNGAMKFGELSPYSCPECKGVLSTIKEGRLVRYRCHTGHGYTSNSLLEALSESIEVSLYNSLRAVEEKISLLQEMRDRTDREKDGAIFRDVEHKMQFERDRIELVRQALEKEE